MPDVGLSRGRVDDLDVGAVADRHLGLKVAPLSVRGIRRGYRERGALFAADLRSAAALLWQSEEVLLKVSSANKVRGADGPAGESRSRATALALGPLAGRLKVKVLMTADGVAGGKPLLVFPTSNSKQRRKQCESGEEATHMVAEHVVLPGCLPGRNHKREERWRFVKRS